MTIMMLMMRAGTAIQSGEDIGTFGRGYSEQDQPNGLFIFSFRYNLSEKLLPYNSSNNF